MLSVARLTKAGYVLGLAITLFCLLRPNMSHGQFGGGIGGNNPNFLQLQLQSEFGAIPVNGLGGGGMMGMGSMNMLGGSVTGLGGGMGGNNPNLLQLRLLSEFGAIPVNGLGGGGMMGIGGGNGMMTGFSGGGMGGFAGKNMGGFNGRHGL